MWWRNYSHTLSKKQNWVHLWINSLKFYTVCFLLYTNLRTIEIMKLSCRLLTLNSYKTLLKNKNGSGKTLPASFSTKFLKTKKLSHILLPDSWPYLIVWLPLIHAKLGNIQWSKGRPLESLESISVIPGFQVVYPCIIRWPNLFLF